MPGQRFELGSDQGNSAHSQPGLEPGLPGGIDSPDAFWQALLRGDDLVTEIPADRWDVEDHYDPERGVPGRSVSRWGGFIDDIGGFDASFFGLGEREATAIDPQHPLLLETSWEAIEHAGIVPPSLAGSRTGVFVGLCHHDYTVVTSDAGVLDDAYSFTGTPFSMAFGRIAYGLGLLDVAWCCAGRHEEAVDWVPGRLEPQRYFEGHQPAHTVAEKGHSAVGLGRGRHHGEDFLGELGNACELC